MSRPAIPVRCFVLVVVKQGRRFLLVHERKHGQLWYLPAGRVEPGEGFFAAAVRETLEEAGIPIELEGILRIEHTPAANGSARLRVIFLARPADDRPLKSTPDEESLSARWVTLGELDALPLRGEEVRQLFADVLGGAPAYPLSLLQTEGRSLLAADAAVEVPAGGNDPARERRVELVRQFGTSAMNAFVCESCVAPFMTGLPRRDRVIESVTLWARNDLDGRFPDITACDHCGTKISVSESKHFLCARLTSLDELEALTTVVAAKS